MDDVLLLRSSGEGHDLQKFDQEMPKSGLESEDVVSSLSKGFSMMHVIIFTSLCQSQHRD